MASRELAEKVKSEKRKATSAVDAWGAGIAKVNTGRVEHKPTVIETPPAIQEAPSYTPQPTTPPARETHTVEQVSNVPRKRSGARKIMEKRSRLCVYIPEELYIQMVQQSQMDGISQSEFIRRAIRKELRNY